MHIKNRELKNNRGWLVLKLSATHYTLQSNKSNTASFKTILGLREWNNEMLRREAAGVVAMKKKWGGEREARGASRFLMSCAIHMIH